MIRPRACGREDDELARTVHRLATGLVAADASLAAALAALRRGDTTAAVRLVERARRELMGRTAAA